MRRWQSEQNNGTSAAVHDAERGERVCRQSDALVEPTCVRAVVMLANALLLLQCATRFGTFRVDDVSV
jgi:hypothetical protein